MIFGDLGSPGFILEVGGPIFRISRIFVFLEALRPRKGSRPNAASNPLFIVVCCCCCFFECSFFISFFCDFECPEIPY